ncbi:MAG: fatty acid desaturase [Deltaproteobacteria bacterium]|nr:fatty acid desaturase [Deltaproteobacteria bacterium]
MTAEFLSRHKHGLYWLHISLVVGTICLIVPVIAWTGGAVPSGFRALIIFVLTTVAFCQNQGLVHHCAHHLPKGPYPLGLYAARFLHYLGGLPYTKTRFAHRLHHAHLGSSLDPDRVGYESTTTVMKRLRYLVLIGPLRARFAPVDTSYALNAMSPDRRAQHERSCRRDWRLVGLTHLILMGLCGLYYPVVFAALLFANVLSNVREMAEHGNRGQGAYINLDVSVPGVLFFSTPGFWFHAVHHMDASIHYLDLPSVARRFTPKTNLPFLQRHSAVAYLFTGR